jgi:hypothetical protein
MDEEARLGVARGGRAPMQAQLAQDLVAAVRSAFAGDVDSARATQLSVLEDEHRLLSDRQRRLHESIELLERPDSLKAEAAARLQLYQANDERL